MQNRKPKLWPVQKSVIKLLDRMARPAPVNFFVITKPEISLLCRWSVAMHSGCPAGIEGYEDQIAKLNTMLENNLVQLSWEHENEGLAFLWANHKNGWLGSREVRALRDFNHFTLAGVETKKSGMRWASAPRYTMHGRHDSFTYVAWSWQSGFKPYVESNN